MEASMALIISLLESSCMGYIQVFIITFSRGGQAKLSDRNLLSLVS